MRNGFVGSVITAGALALATGVAFAGGFDRGGVNIDQLFDTARFSAESGVTYVSPQRKIKNVRRLDGSGTRSGEIEVDGDYTVPRVGFKANVFAPVDCLGTYTEPYGVDAEYGKDNAYSPTAVRFGVGTRDYGLTCSYKFDLGRGQARIIGGASYGEVDAFLSRQTLQTFVIPSPPFPPAVAGVKHNRGIGTFQLSDEAWSWRVGAAYEIPEIALRATLMYSAKYDYDNLAGTVDTTGFAGGPTNPLGPPGAFLGERDVTAASEVPQALEFKLQTGIATDWLGFGSLKWQQWSKLGVIPIKGVVSPVTGLPSNVSFDPLYRDGWTITGGVGHKFTDMIGGAASITWDRGTSTTNGIQSDTWNFTTGASVTPNENVEFRLGGSIGILTSGSSAFGGVGDTANAIAYDYGNDLLLAGSASLKVKF